MLNEGNQIHNFVLRVSENFCDSIFLRFRNRNYGSYESGSDFLTSYGSGSGSTRQEVTVPPVPVPQHCLRSPAEKQ